MIDQALDAMDQLQGECGCRWREMDKDLRVNRYVCQHGEWTAEQSALFAARMQALREAL